MKSLLKFLFIATISLVFVAPTTALAGKSENKSGLATELPQKEGARQPASKKKGKKKGKKKHKPSAGEIKARRYFSSTGN